MHVRNITETLDRGEHMALRLGATLPVLFRTLEMVAVETPAASATSRMVMAIVHGSKKTAEEANCEFKSYKDLAEFSIPAEKFCLTSFEISCYQDNGLSV